MSYFRDRWEGVGAIAAARRAPRSAPAPTIRRYQLGAVDTGKDTRPTSPVRQTDIGGGGRPGGGVVVPPPKPPTKPPSSSAFLSTRAAFTTLPTVTATAPFVRTFTPVPQPPSGPGPLPPDTTPPVPPTCQVGFVLDANGNCVAVPIDPGTGGGSSGGGSSGGGGGGGGGSGGGGVITDPGPLPTYDPGPPVTAPADRRLPIVLVGVGLVAGYLLLRRKS